MLISLNADVVIRKCQFYRIFSIHFPVFTTLRARVHAPFADAPEAPGHD
jgi:hypothetical protein